jgi:HAUS augmin-like complex subunit 1
MAHHLDSNTAIFSPSIARLAASTARDWSYIDTWLASKLPSTSSLPPFERNPETLKALLALASANEQADEERHLLAQAEATALQELQDADTTSSSPQGKFSHRQLREGLLAAIEDELPTEGQTALDALASSAVTLGIANPDPETMARRMITLQTSIYEMEQMKTRVSILQRHLDAELASNEEFLRRLQGNEYKPSEDMPKENLDMQRRVKAASAQLPELQDRVAQLAASVDSNHPTIDDIASQEEAYLELLSRKKELDAQLAAFQGLPSDPDRARAELEALRRQLRGMTSRRDEVFEGLVEQASPVRRR